MAIRHVREAIKHSVSVIGGPPSRLNGHELRTRYSIIDPILRALGWDTSDPSHCEVEFRVPGSGERVDYALFVGKRWERDLAILVEAKSLDRNLESDEEQIAKYAPKFEAEAGVLTNGRRWRIYALGKRVQTYGPKLVEELDITMKTEPQAAIILNRLLSRRAWSGGKRPVSRSMRRR